jgi:hypothetical protein
LEVPRRGGPVSALAKGLERPELLAVSASSAFTLIDGAVNAIPLAGGAPSIIAKDDGPSCLAYRWLWRDGHDLFWFRQRLRWKKDDPALSNLWRLRLP